MILSKSTVLVTGGSRGIGEAVAKVFLQEGAEVIVFDKKQPSYDVRYFQVDISDEEEVRFGLDKVTSIDCLVNNAGVYRQTPVTKFNGEDFEEIFNVNVKGYRMMYTYALPMLEDSEDGNVINISSGLGKQPEPWSDIYSASKAAINCLKTSWANSYAETDVRANAILPNPVETDMLNKAFSDDELMEYKEKQPMREFSEPEDVAEVAVLLASNASLNGAEFEVGGEAHNNQYGL